MKKIKNSTALALVCFATLLPFSVPVMLTVPMVMTAGCNAGHGRWDPNTQTYSNDIAGDPVVVNAQKVRATALNAFQEYFHYEKENRERLWKISPEFKHVADDLRKNGAAYLDALTATISEYQKARTAENKLTIDSAMTLLISATEKAQSFLTKAKAQ